MWLFSGERPRKAQQGSGVVGRDMTCVRDELAIGWMESGLGLWGQGLNQFGRVENNTVIIIVQ